MTGLRALAHGSLGRVVALVAGAALTASLRVPARPQPGGGDLAGSCRESAVGASLGAPPVWPCRERAAAATEEQLRTVLDKWERHTEPGKSLLAAQEKPPFAEGLGRISGAQPFVFGHLFASSAGVVREVERPVDNQVVLEKTATDGVGFGVPESVFLDEGRFVMFYHSENVGARGHGLARAESADGITWVNRQRLNVSVIHSLESCVLLDVYERDPRFKWKMTANCARHTDSVCFFTSPDGIHWVQHGLGRPIYGKQADTLPCLYHDGPDRDYQLILRTEPPNPANDGRGIRGSKVLSGPLDEVLRSVNETVTWAPAVRSEFILDREGGGSEMFRRQLYSLSRTLLPGAGGYLGVAQVLEFVERGTPFQFQKDLKSAVMLGLGEDFDSGHLYLMPSRDGAHFDPSWVYAGARLLPPDLTHGFHFFSQAGQVLTHGGYHWLYYDRTDRRHFNRWTGTAQVALARFRENRIVRVRPTGSGSGVVVTQSFVFVRDQALTLDVLSLTDAGEVTAELLSGSAESRDAFPDLLQRPAIARSEPLRGINGSARVRWLGDTAAQQDRAVHLRLHLVGVYVYGFAL